MRFIEENPWTCSLTLILAIFSAILLPSPLQDFLININFNNVTQDPAGTLTGFVIGYPIAVMGEVFIRVISGLIGGIVGAIIGMIIDFKRNSYGGL